MNPGRHGFIPWRTHDRLLKREQLYQLSYERNIQIKDKKEGIRDKNINIIYQKIFVCQ